MLFSSFEFLFFFLPIAFWVYFFIVRSKKIIFAKIWLIFCSLFYYGWWNPSYLFLISFSLFVNYSIGLTLIKSTLDHRKILVTVGVIFNVLLLGYFKYTDFLIGNINLIFGSTYELKGIVLPLAISFFTFQQIAYLVDSYNGDTKEYSFLNYTLFVTFFPQLIAGPIVHHKEMMPQFSSARTFVRNIKNINLGLLIFSIGLFKKVILADTFSEWANWGFNNSTNLDFYSSWKTSLSYTFQLYFDFSATRTWQLGLLCYLILGCQSTSIHLIKHLIFKTFGEDGI
jgi:alginate O-acetyltransferase complex protein AlgI